MSSDTSIIDILMNDTDVSIDPKYTSSQLIETLDDLLYICISYIIKYTDFFDGVILELFIYVCFNSKRSISMVDEEYLVEKFLEYLCVESVETKLKLYKNMQLERGVALRIISHFNSITKPLINQECNYLSGNFPLDLTKNIKEARFNDPINIFICSKGVDSWLAICIEYRSSLIRKYITASLAKAKLFWKKRKFCVTLDDLAQNVILGIGRGVDKCNLQKGTLSASVNNWVRDSLRTNSHFKLGFSTKGRVPFLSNVSLEETNELETTSFQYMPENEDIVNSGDFIRFHIPDESLIEEPLLYLIKYTDPEGYARQELGIPEILNSDEKKLLLSISWQTWRVN